MRRIAEQPAVRELERIEALKAAVPAPFFEQAPQHGRSLRWLKLARMVEEFRLSLFAPSLAVKGRSSAKKLESEASWLR